MLVAWRVVGLIEKSKSPSLTLRVSFGFSRFGNRWLGRCVKCATSKLRVGSLWFHDSF